MMTAERVEAARAAARAARDVHDAAVAELRDAVKAHQDAVAASGRGHTCPRRGEIGTPMAYAQTVDSDEYEKRGDGRACSYCGSMAPDDFMAAIRAGVEVSPTSKSYKAYVGRSGKFYFQHLDEAQRREFVDLQNAKRIAWAAHPHVLPFFMARAEAS